MFWHTDDELFNLDDIIARRDVFLEKAKNSSKVAVDDCVLLDQALEVVYVTKFPRFVLF